MSIAEKLVTIAENVHKVYEAGKATVDGYSDGVESGKQAERKAFWDAYQRGGRRYQYRCAFFDALWNDTTYNPVYPIICSALSSDAFRYSQIKNTKVDIDFSHVGSTYVFGNCTLLHTIKKLKVTEDVTFTNWFVNCPVLESITFEGVIGQNLDLSYSPWITLYTIDTIIDCLKRLEEGETRTLSLNEEVISVINSLDLPHIAQITQKGWTVA